MTRFYVGAALLAVLLAGCGAPHKVDRYDAAKVVDQLAADDAKTRDWAEQSLAMSDPADVWGPMVELFGDAAKSKPAARVAAIRIFAKTADYDRQFPLSAARAVLDDPDVSVRRAALRATIEFGNPSNRTWLDAAAEKEADPALKKEIEEALAKDWLPHAKEWWRARIEHPRKESETVLSIRALASNGGPEEAKFLIAQWDGFKADGPKFETILALSRIGGDEAAAFVRGKLRSSDDYVRSAATTAEIALKDPLAIDALQTTLTQDPIFDMRVAAAQALAGIGGDPALKALDEACQNPPQVRVKVECDRAKAAIKGGPRVVEKEARR